ncbi:DNA ligase-like protein [Wolffia australiana]
MNGAADEISVSIPEESCFPLQEDRKLKRLKKASEIADPIEEKDFDDGLEPLFGVRFDADESRMKSFEEDADVEKFEGNEMPGEAVGDRGKTESAKRRLTMEEGMESGEKKKASRKRRAKEGKATESAREKRRLEKERNAHLEQLHAESQKLLRETRNASFKPVTVQDKPISSVLEKIRRRKQELLQKSAVGGNQHDQFGCPTSNSVVEGAQLSQPTNDEESLETSRTEGDFPANNTQEPGDDTQQCDYTKDYSADKVHAPSYSSDSSDESSSEEENYDKENINPILQRTETVDLYKKNDLVKGFLDDEAEEEDDSDHDKMRFNDDEDEDDDDDCSGEAEILADLIEPGYKEKKKDTDKRNELHQKWLQYQDAADTDNLLQRLTSHSKDPKIPFLIKKEDDDEELEEEEEEEDEEEEDSEQPGNLNRVNSARLNARNAKKRMAMMFTDSDVAYVSDDEETEETVIRNCLILDHSLEKSSVFAPAEDENSREVFGLIKKVNSLPATKRKLNSISTSFDTLAIGRSGVAFKPLFMGRTAGNLQTSSMRQVSSVSKSFIFSRDDSNSRSSDVSADILPDVPRQQPVKTKEPERSTQLRRAPSDDSSGASLFQILRRRVDRTALTSSNSISSQTARQFSAFRLTKKSS